MIKMLQKEYALAIFSIISWASAPIIFKSLITDLDFKSATFFFLLFGALAMFAYLAITNWRRIIDIKKKQIWFIFVMGLANYLHYLCYTYSLSCLKASMVITLAKLSPIFQITLAVSLLQERIRRKTYLVFLLGFLGAGVVVADGQLVITPNKAFLTAILAGFFWALFIVIAKKSQMDFFAAIGWALLAGAVFTGLHLSLNKSLIYPYGNQWPWLIFLGVVPTALGVVMWVKAIDESHGVAKIVNLEYLTPSIGIILAWVFLKEKISIYLIIGLSIILVSVYWNANQCKCGEQISKEVDL